MLPCVCSVIDRRGRQNVVRTYTLARQNLFVKLIKHDCVYDALENEDLCSLLIVVLFVAVTWGRERCVALRDPFKAQLQRRIPLQSLLEQLYYSPSFSMSNRDVGCAYLTIHFKST